MAGPGGAGAEGPVPRVRRQTAKAANLRVGRSPALNTSPLEGSFLHWRASRHPTAKGAGPKSTQIHTNMWDFNWSLNAAAAANLMRTIHHHQPWLIDAIAHTCRGWLPDDELPPIVQNWACIDTTIAPCTFRGMDWEAVNL